MKPRFESLDSLLTHFNGSREVFCEHDVESALIALKKQLNELGGPVVPAIDHELLAFAFHDERYFSRDRKDGWFVEHFSGRTESGEIIAHPNAIAISQAAIEYWASRAEAASHPILRFRYAALVWHYALLGASLPSRITMAHLLIDAAVELAGTRSHRFESEIIGKLSKSLGTAIRINDCSGPRFLDHLIS
jgi:hypothetical protein